MSGTTASIVAAVVLAGCVRGSEASPEDWPVVVRIADDPTIDVTLPEASARVARPDPGRLVVEFLDAEPKVTWARWALLLDVVEVDGPTAAPRVLAHFRPDETFPDTVPRWSVPLEGEIVIDRARLDDGRLRASFDVDVSVERLRGRVDVPLDAAHALPDADVDVLLQQLAPPSLPPREPTDEDVRAVILAVLERGSALEPTERALFRRTTAGLSWFVGDHDWRRVHGLRPGLSTATVEAAAADAEDHPEWLGELGVGFIDDATWDAHFEGRSREEGWDAVRRGPPECTVVVSISKPVFSDDGRQALVSVAESRHVLWADGAVWLVEYEAGTWRATLVLASWVS